MLPIAETTFGTTATVMCPLKGKHRFAHKACPECEHFEGIGMRTNAEKVEISPGASEGKAERDIMWHEKFVVRCSAVREIRCQDYSVMSE